MPRPISKRDSITNWSIYKYVTLKMTTHLRSSACTQKWCGKTLRVQYWFKNLKENHVASFSKLAHCIMNSQHNSIDSIVFRLKDFFTIIYHYNKHSLYIGNNFISFKNAQISTIISIQIVWGQLKSVNTDILPALISLWKRLNNY